MSLRSDWLVVASVVAGFGCGGQGSDGQGTPSEVLAGATSTASAGSAGTASAAGGSATAGVDGGGSSGSAAGGDASSGGSESGGASQAGCSFVACGGGAGAAGAGGSGGSGGSGGASGGQLHRLLAFDYVDVNPDTGTLRGHTGGGADEKLLQTLGAEHGFEVIVTDKGADFTSENLAKFDVVAFTSPDYDGQALSNGQRAALEAFVRRGGGWLGWHYGLWIEKGWTFLGVLGGGAIAKGHVGSEQAMTFTVVNTAHPIMQGMPATYAVKDDFLAMTGDPSQDPKVSVLVRAALTADPGGSDRPVVWAHEIDKGRAFYSMLGHSAADFTTPEAKILMWNALRWVSRARP
ncbi:MAG TPA: ThuA domain-containing protein [Polyangiaceae bacterium]|nr:ThuA domain-containing protein [Polyangiaceae bacterium]